MTGNNLSRADPWLQTASNDLEAARFLRQGKFWSLVCFMSHQSAEKALKACLRACGETSYEGHGLAGLCHRCAAYSSDFLNILDACRRLGRHYIPTRYPDAAGDEPPESLYMESDAEQALADAAQVVEAAHACLDSLRNGAKADTPQNSSDQPK